MIQFLVGYDERRRGLSKRGKGVITVHKANVETEDEREGGKLDPFIRQEISVDALAYRLWLTKVDW